ncbi:unnamed protein product [Bursaphelenchus xylophilus]|nr:unnamed protein product [Bursaphelenchus xylophilus]CAG9080842.1 unnamed protein product [Bursaphelenchus xylophilus]
MIRLQHALKDGAAAYIVDNRERTREDYESVITILTTRYLNRSKIEDFLEFELLAIPSPTHNSSRSLLEFADRIDTFRSRFKHNNSEIPRTIVKKLFLKLDTKTREHATLRSSVKGYDLHNINDFLTFLYELALEMEQWQLSSDNVSQKPQVPNHPVSRPKGDIVRPPRIERPPASNVVLSCPFCSETHKASECPKFKSYSERIESLKSQRRCYRCFSPDHMITRCHRTFICGKCRRNHQTFMCSPPKGSSNSTPLGNIDSGVEPSSPALVFAITNNGQFDCQGETQDTTSQLPVKYCCFSANAEIPQSKVAPHPVHVFIDCGSDLNLIKKSTALLLNPRLKLNGNLNIGTLNGSIGSKTSRLTVLFTPGAQDSSNLPPIPSKPVEIVLNVVDDKFFDKLKGPKFSKSVDTLLGVQAMTKLNMTVTDSRSPSGYTLVKSSLGYFEAGAPLSYEPVHPSHTLQAHVLFLQNQSRPDPFESIQDFDLVRYSNWTDSMGITKEDSLSKRESDLKTLEFVLKNTTQDPQTGRYSVPLPFKHEKTPLVLPDYKKCRARLSGIIRQLQKDPKLLAHYHKNFVDQESNGIIEKCSVFEYTKGKTRYIPHLPVARPDHPTTPVRNVFDASSKDESDQSLNSMLNQGLTLLPDLPSTILSVRKSKYLAIADLEKAFLMLDIHPEYRDYVRFLWVKDPSRPPTQDNLQAYRFRRVTFGLVCSPALLGAVLHHHILKNSDILGQEMTESILKTLYVDNMFIQADNPDLVSDTCQKLKKIFSDSAMNLREFASNIPDFVDSFPPHDLASGVLQKILGMGWNTLTDQLSLTPKEPKKLEIKCDPLQFQMRNYDPNGLISPAILPIKRINQELSQIPNGWKSELSEEIKLRLQTIVDGWSVEKILVDRYFGPPPYSLHAFSDACSYGIGACIYISSVDQSFPPALVYAKANVKPSNITQSIPNLELLSTETAVLLMSNVSKTLYPHVEKHFVWSDSEIALKKIENRDNRERFVANRIKSIYSHVPDGTIFRHVPGEQNPADVASRGVPLNELRTLDIWWHGPSFLRDEAYKPSMAFVLKNSGATVDYEADCFHVSEEVSETQSLWQLFFSQFPQGCIEDFCKSHEFFVTLSSELNQLNGWLEKAIRLEQERSPPSSSQIKNWRLRKDSLNLWHIDGRIVNSNFGFRRKNPYFISQKSSLIPLVIRKLHECHGHMNSSSTLQILREYFWFPQSRKIITSLIIKACPNCALDRKTFTPPCYLPKLPETRTQFDFVFQDVGVDLIGPIATQEGPIHIILWTCLTSRGVFLDTLYPASAKSFLNCLDKLKAIYGLPSSILSDHASYFELARKAIMIAQNEGLVVEEFCQNQKIRWNFTVSRAPWQGGAYERLVALVKQLLTKKFIISRLKAKSELKTALPHIATVINCRPLTIVNSKSPIILTPMNMLCPLRQPLSLPRFELDEVYTPSPHDSPETLAQTFAKTQNFVAKVKAVWNDMYLETLITQKSKNSVVAPPEFVKGDLVVFSSDKPHGPKYEIARVDRVRSKDQVPVEVVLETDAKKTVSRHPRSVKMLFPVKKLSQKETKDVARPPETPSSGSNTPGPECHDSVKNSQELA